jgi:hypothetical protein
MMSISVSQELSEVKSRSKKLVHANHSQMADEVAAVVARISHGTCRNQQLYQHWQTVIMAKGHECGCGYMQMCGKQVDMQYV